MAKNLFTFLALIWCILCQSQLLFDSSYDSSDKKIIENITEKYSQHKTHSVKEFENYLQDYTQKNPLKNADAKSIVTNVFIACKTADEKDQINNTSTPLLENALNTAKKEKRVDLEIWVALNYAYYYYKYRKYDKCLPLFMLCINKLDNTNDKKVIEITDTYKKIAYFLTTNKDYKKAKDYLIKAEKYAKNNSSDLASIYNALGICYKETNELKAAENYFYKTLNISRKCKDELRYAKALGSLAELEFLKKNHTVAIQLLHQDIEISKNNRNDQNTMYALKTLSKIYFDKGDIVNTEKYLLEAQKFCNTKSYFKSTEYEILELLIKVNHIKGNDKKELELRRKLDQLSDSLKSFDGKETIQKISWESQKYQMELKFAKEKSEHEKDSYLKIIAIIFCALLMVTIIFIIRSYKHKIRSKKSKYEAKVLNLTIDKINSENKLISTNNTLQSYQIYLEEKNKQITILQKEIETIKKSTFSNLEEKSGNLQKLLESHLMTDENWKNFKKAFVETYPLEYQKLQENFPDLTNSNLRIIVLTKMNMNNTEISRLLGVTLDAVKKAKHRLRKKYENTYEELFELIEIKKPL